MRVLFFPMMLFTLAPAAALQAQDGVIPEVAETPAEINWPAERLIGSITLTQDPHTGLPVSFPDSSDGLLKNIAFTYDVALSALVLSHAGDWKQARSALAFYEAVPLPTPDAFYFNTAYHAQLGVPKLEYRVHGGPIFWMAIAMLRYAQATGDYALRNKAVELLDWARRHLPHIDGGVVMSQRDEWKDILSTENNWVYYAALRVAIEMMPNGSQREAFREEAKNVRAWLTRLGNNRGFRVPSTFDPVQALDVYTHPLLIGPAAQMEEEGFASEDDLAKWAVEHIANLEARFRVSGTDLYDYTDAAECQAVGRYRAGWLEGTEQVVVAYQVWAPWFRGIGDYAYAAFLDDQAVVSHAAVKRLALSSEAGGIWIPNTDAPVAFLTFHDGWKARPRSESALNGTTWTYFAECRYNPFTAHLPICPACEGAVE